MSQFLPQLGSAAYMAFIVVVVFTVLMALIPPNRSLLYRGITFLFFATVLFAIALGGVILFTLLFRRA